jgi:hypothetical protein
MVGERSRDGSSDVVQGHHLLHLGEHGERGNILLRVRNEACLMRGMAGGQAEAENEAGIPGDRTLIKRP